eukprot:TRINITY_DN39587_c0_g1_i4.p1 TRINITY_DN39587_c0_g1~~TRINITY_DN39587_c0_g1_i4.p1  ORF type:complete len:223 (+),score=48.57 TRINITY_DN39587_c0_g1_i4:207-875(+)
MIPTTVPQKKPVLRSAFVFVPIPSADDAFFADQGHGDVVHYGQKIAIQTHPGLLEDPLFLMSERKTPDSQSKVSGNQAVYFTDEPGQAGLWKIMYGNPEYREEMVGQPVKANALIVVQHTPTNTPLASTKAKLVNDFGPEFEVCAHRYQTFRSKSGSAPEEKAGFWAAVTAPSNVESVSYTHLRAHETPEHLVCRLLLEKKKISKKDYSTCYKNTKKNNSMK